MKNIRLSPGRIMALGFLSVILTGSVLLSLPVAHSGAAEITYLDALFTATSSVCVTGLVTVETGMAFSMFGQAVIMILLQIGGLGITTLGAGLIALLGGRLNQRENNLVKEALNYPTWNGIKPLIRAVVIMDFTVETIGAVFMFFTFSRHYPVGRAVWYSIFHSVSAFNNGGFDVLGRGDSLASLSGDIYFNIVISVIIILGGAGFFVIRELAFYRKGERFSLHTKVVAFMTLLLVVGGTLMIKLSERGGISWLGALFQSVTARTAGFFTYPISGFTNAGIIITCVLMFIGASPGSTGGGVKTTTFFALVKSIISNSTGREARAFGKRLKDDMLHRAFIIISLALLWIIVCTFTLTLLEPDIALRDLIFEEISAVTTTGLSTGITSVLSVPSKLVLIISMYVGRLGPLTIATLWTISRPCGVSRPEEDLPIG